MKGRGSHLLVDCTEVSPEVCLDDRKFLRCMAEAAERAGANVISQVRYHFGHNSPPGFTCMILLDESHVSAHCYSETGMIALDIFTCGSTDPHNVLAILRGSIDLGTISVREFSRFIES